MPRTPQDYMDVINILKLVLEEEPFHDLAWIPLRRMFVAKCLALLEEASATQTRVASTRAMFEKLFELYAEPVATTVDIAGTGISIDPPQAAVGKLHRAQATQTEVITWDDLSREERIAQIRLALAGKPTAVKLPPRNVWGRHYKEAFASPPNEMIDE